MLMHKKNIHFKKKLLSIIRPTVRSIFGINDPTALPYLTHLRVVLSKLNVLKFKHNFRDTINPMCSMNDGIQDTEHGTTETHHRLTFFAVQL